MMMTGMTKKMSADRCINRSKLFDMFSSKYNANMHILLPNTGDESGNVGQCGMR